jgi:hypothetical protein
MVSENPHGRKDLGGLFIAWGRTQFLGIDLAQKLTEIVAQMAGTHVF